MLHSFYNGVEKILKQAVRFRGFDSPDGGSWHRDLIDLAAREGVITKSTVEKLAPYLAFRHFFRHCYALDLSAEQMEPLVRDIRSAYDAFRNDIIGS